MANAKAKIEALFETTGRHLYRNRIKVLLPVILIIGLFIYRLPSITIDTSSESLLHKDEPSILEYNRFREQFGRSELIIIAVQAPHVFEADFLGRLKSFHRDLEEEIPYLRKIHSLINARDTRGEADQLIVEDLFEDWPEKIAGLDDLKNRVLNNPFYANHLISEDGRIAAVLIETEALVAASVSEEDILADFAEDEMEAPPTSATSHYFSEKENRKVVDAVKRIVKRYHAKDFALTASGGPIVVDAFNRATMKDIQKCIVMSLVAVAFFLAITFWRLSGVFLPMLVIVSSLVSILGLMAWLNVPIKITTTVIPAFLLALTPLRPSRAIARKSAVMDDILRAVARFSAAHPIKIMVVSMIILAVFFPAIFTLKFSHNVVRYFPDSLPYRHELNYIDQHLKGTITLELVLDTGRENGVHDPWILNRIEMFCRKTEQIQRQDISVGKVYSITDILKEIHQALNENKVAFYRIPNTRELIAQEFLLFENSGADDLERIVDSQFSKTRITIKRPWVDAVVCKEFVEEINRKMQTVFQGNATIQSTGMMSLLVRAIVAAIYSTAKSYVIAFVVITLLMILLIGDWKIGLLSMVPNLLPIIITMGCMGLAKIPLDINSLMIGSIALGIVVDDTVHFMYNFQRYYHKTADPYVAIEKTLLGTGRALLITSLVLCTGFFILLSASLNNFVIFGFFTGVTILIALLADFVLVPALMLLIERKRQALTGLV
jgi:predicted RND superfamily exporter protein